MLENKSSEGAVSIDIGATNKACAVSVLYPFSFRNKLGFVLFLTIAFYEGIEMSHQDQNCPPATLLEGKVKENIERDGVEYRKEERQREKKTLKVN